MYEYLIGCLILAAFWGLVLALRKDLLKPMTWTGGVYVIAMTVVFICFRAIQIILNIRSSIVPGYWDPNTLFNLSRVTGGYGIEDTLFMFFTGGIAASIYELFFRKRIKFKKYYKYHFRAPIIALVAAGIFLMIFNISLIYPIIIFNLAGALLIWVERRDLVSQSILSGVLFALFYFLLFYIFNNVIFPDFVGRVYHLIGTSRIIVGGIPLEEILYALTFGFWWAPLYEYEHGEVDVNV